MRPPKPSVAQTVRSGPTRSRPSGTCSSAYLPAALSPEELDALVTEMLAEGGFSGMGAMGPAMKAVTAKVAGRADGKVVSAMVRERLASG